MSHTSQSTLDRTNARRYGWELGSAMAAYTILLVLALSLYNEGGSTAANLALMLMPVVPALGIAWACLRMVQRSDEFVRARQLEAVAIGFVLAMVAAVTMGFLTNVVAIPVAPWIIYGFGMAGWAGGTVVRSRA